MNILIPHSWLMDHLKTKATRAQIAKYLSLCGPSVERIYKKKNDWVYDIEVTTNRVDSMSVRGIAREGAAILPRFGIPATLKPLKLVTPDTPRLGLPFKIVNNPKLVSRAIGIVLELGEKWESPDWMKNRLEMSGVRSLNSVVDITNYVMLELGHPSHAFDYDKITSRKFVIRESDKGEKVTSFDGKTHVLGGGDIVFDDGEGRIIDLPGIIGTKNSVVSKQTKRVFFFVDNNDPVRIRKTSMGLDIRTMAATLNEKGVDPELAMSAILRGVELYRKVCGAKVVSRIYDVYPKKPKIRTIKVSHDFIQSRLGVNLGKAEIGRYLKALEFECKWGGDILTVRPPSFRSSDIEIPEDIVEEVARIYGYHNIPSKIMTGEMPDKIPGSPFEFERELKSILKGMGVVEVYTSSLVGKDFVSKGALRLKNPMGKDSEYLRTSLRPSLVGVVDDNKREDDPFVVFEMAKVYHPVKKSLPQERQVLGIIFNKIDYRTAKGIVESLLDRVNADFKFMQEESEGFLPSSRLVVKSGGAEVGHFGTLENDLIYAEFDVVALQKVSSSVSPIAPLPKYPSQVEDVTFSMPKKTLVGEVIGQIIKTNKQVVNAELREIYRDNYTFRIWYRNTDKTLTNKEVEKLRKIVINSVGKEFGGVVKG